jgi:hypothetical protein
MAKEPQEPNKPPGNAEPTDRWRERKPNEPLYRRLRVFAFDPLFSTQLETVCINRLTLPVVWEERLAPGPVGEYLEVTDENPDNDARERLDLNHPHLLAADGLAPSEADPKFHRQMVYAVAMTTIRHFEQALGRRAMWSTRGGGAENRFDEQFIPRLKVYPHGLNEANAYYSPERIALRFGSFTASQDSPGRNLPGGTIHTCLSHDVVAHETTHALLDGMHHRFLDASNPDVYAFHEAFADLVALFQHFTFPDVLRDQIARNHAGLGTSNYLAQLARQFGEAIGKRGALRDALGDRAQPRRLEDALREPHTRGSILVAAVFDAFVSIYESRTADLIRIATNGQGILPAGALHPDLVNRLAQEAAKSARHVLTMCIRALDYTPPVDLTFGEYLRALITADADLIEDDDLNYRIAVIEAFRRRAIYPHHVESLAVDSLVWNKVQDDPAQDRALALIRPDAKPLLDRLNSWDLSANRRQVFEYARYLRRFFHHRVAGIRDDALRRGEGRIARLEELTGLALSQEAPYSILRSKNDGLPAFEIHAVRPVRRVGPDGQLRQSLIVELLQQRAGFFDRKRQQKADAGELPDSAVAKKDFVFRGGCTVIYDLETAKPRYFIKKRIQSGDRADRQRDHLRTADTFSLKVGAAAEPFALLHGRGVRGDVAVG